jgi:enolase
LERSGRRHGIADEGGFWPAFDSNEQGLEFLTEAIEDAGFVPGDDVGIALDVAANEFWCGSHYMLNSEQRRCEPDEWLELLCSWVQRYAVVSVEDPCAEHDLKGMRQFTEAVGPYVQVVADDLVVTSAARIRDAAEQGAGNAALIKPNQVGTLTEARAAVDATRDVGWGAIASARSGETEDTTIVHLAVGWGLPQLKVGALARGERTAKWNEGLRIAEDLSDGGQLPPADKFPWGRRG